MFGDTWPDSDWTQSNESGSLIDRAHVVLRIAIDAFVVRIDTRERRFARGDQVERLRARANRLALEEEHGCRGEVLLARLGGKNPDIERLIERRFVLPPLPVRVELSRVDLESDIPLAIGASCFRAPVTFTS